MAERKTGPSAQPADKPQPQKAPAGQPAAGKHPPAHHKKEEKPAAEAPPRSRVEQWLDAYLEATMAAAAARKFEGTMEVTDFIPQIRVELRRKHPPVLGRPLAALGAMALGLVLGGASWAWLPPASTVHAAGWAVALLLFGFGLVRLLWPPTVRLKMDSLINRLQWWDTRGRLREITFIGCQWIDLEEWRGLRGFRYRITIEPRWGSTVPIASTGPRARPEALLNAVELVRSLVKVSRLPVRVKLSRWARGEPALPPVPQAKPAAEKAEE